ncbi:uncharacterized protein FOMMEDRAFT_160776 [Fomitiporia mediterranea MF3/22]|uniref:uncharacterized protein n=1 Tax=Fomitiporia mediterranea (strain MF3/22) TaxID=694068 RepID=UPI0004408DBC|nr:uncharacterized protein FOMMEDRAFT_160776 [Fomitiporia mediterranea MF3/22]EJC99201.1 hypothetical protein FOMMEDRAFT_160776 [Fomitiporia mediterranea MF3/22]
MSSTVRKSETDHKSETDRHDETKKPHVENPTDWTPETKAMLAKKEKPPTLTEEDERQLKKLDHKLEHLKCSFAGPTGRPGRNFFIKDIKYSEVGPEITITSKCKCGALSGSRVGLGNLHGEPYKPATLAQLAERTIEGIDAEHVCEYLS